MSLPLQLLRGHKRVDRIFLIPGSTYAPDGRVEDLKGKVIGQEEVTGLSEVAACSALCNTSTLYYNEGEQLISRLSGTIFILCCKEKLEHYNTHDQFRIMLANLYSCSYSRICLAYSLNGSFTGF